MRAPLLFGSPLDVPGQSRRLRAARIARLLEPLSRGLGGYVSTQLVVCCPSGRVRRPDVAVARGEPPVDGRVAQVPELVVLLGRGAGTSAEAEAWLREGALAVWCLGGGEAVSYAAPRGVPRVRRGRWLTVPGLPVLRTDVADLPP